MSLLLCLTKDGRGGARPSSGAKTYRTPKADATIGGRQNLHSSVGTGDVISVATIQRGAFVHEPVVFKRRDPVCPLRPRPPLALKLARIPPKFFRRSSETVRLHCKL